MTDALPHAHVLLVSRPLAPGRPDGTVQLVRTLAMAGAETTPEIRYRVLLPAGAPPLHAAVEHRITGLDTRSTAWRPLTLARLLSTPNQWIRHYFFTPTPTLVALLRRVQRLRPAPSVQTLCSTPPPDADLRRLVFADVVVALSEDTRARLLAAGIPARRIHRIPPAVRAPGSDPETAARCRARLGIPTEAELIVYLGDWDTAGAAHQVAAALPRLLAPSHRHAVIACRPKGAEHPRIAREARHLLARGGAPASRVHVRGTLPDAPALAAAADLALFPAARLPDKMDLPLALLESLAAGVPAVVAERGPLSDLVRDGAAVGVPAGDPEALAFVADALLRDGCRRRAQGEAGRTWCAQHTAPARLAREHARLYQRLLRTRS